MTHPSKFRLVVLETPFMGKGDTNEARARDAAENLAYARACLADCLRRGESPIASHLLLTQPGVLDDAIPGERAKGIGAGHAWMRVADAVVVYTDRGKSSGMLAGIEAAGKNKWIEYRSLERK